MIINKELSLSYLLGTRSVQLSSEGASAKELIYNAKVIIGGISLRLLDTEFRVMSEVLSELLEEVKHV